MRSYKSYCSVIFLLLYTQCFGVTMIPTSPTNSSGGDDVRSRDGTACHQGIHVGPTMDFGMSGGQSTIPSNNNNNMFGNNNYNANSAGDIGLYARVIVPLGDGPPRVDCTSLYNLEIERLTMELEKLKKSGSSTVTVE